ncbi:MAG TPA: sugar phosphate isomerase/epimerase family protein [Armatimonadota bacterium]|nr:sugar phosphate isomerase/epimerase [Armatimonadota bacterium]HPT97928.1 sugar phosphate isomerase/epimerase family protein [Armatimonadota bacterium]
MKLGLVTYNLASDWDVPTIIERCQRTGFEGVELRTSHAHGVEPDLSPMARAEVRQRFADSGVTLWGLGSVCEFHSPDPAVVREQIEMCRSFVKLAADVGARGVKVRPNGLAEEQGIPVERTLEQIGLALRECGQAAADAGVEIWLEVHGRGTSHPPYIRTILDHCDHPAVGACWNSNDTDVKDGSIAEYFDLLAPDIRSVHITELWREQYPWRELFAGLNRIGYDRFTLAEVPANADPERLMRYYRALWLELSRPA